jgi:RNA polymerase sigma-70 factor, ECF subfamily
MRASSARQSAGRLAPAPDLATLRPARTPRGFGAFEELVGQHRSAVYGLALRMMKDPRDAEDVLQDTFLSAWKNLPAFRGDSALGSWLYRICANHCLMRLRRRGTELLDAPAPEELPGPSFDSDDRLVPSRTPDWSKGAEQEALNDELREAIERATAALPVEYRAVFLLKDVDGLSYEDIAQATGTSLPSVKSRLHRARLALREAIDAFYGGPGLALAGA